MYSIHDLYRKIKTFWNSNKSKILIQLIIVFVSIFSFLIGKSSQKELDNNNIYIVNSNGGLENITSLPESGSITNTSSIQYKSSETGVSNSMNNARYVASSRGKLYYRIGCGGSTKLVESNKIYFNTIEEAERRGYKPASNCAP